MPSKVVLELLDCGIIKFNPNWRTADGDILLELACQSKIILLQTSSASVLDWFGDATINKVGKSIPDSKTADGKILVQLVCLSEFYVSHVSTTVLSK